MNLPEPLERLIEELAKLPGVGRKSARRMAFALLAKSPKECQRLAKAIDLAATEIQHCEICHGLTDQQPCKICGDSRREHSRICVVEDAKNVFTLEESGVFDGLYHVLGGAISPMRGIGPEMLAIASLLERLEDKEITEVILATNPTLEGEATAHFLTSQLQGRVARITRIARGMPSGGDLEYADSNTLARAFEDRLNFGS